MGKIVHSVFRSSRTSRSNCAGIGERDKDEIMNHIVTAKSKLFTIGCKSCGSDNVRVSLMNEPVEMGHELGNVVSTFLKCKSCGKEEWVVDTTV